MADTTKTASVLNIECSFLDGDTRTITLKNPRTGISASDIASLETFIQENNLVIGDRANSDFRKIKKAFIRHTTTTNLDLG